MWYSRTRLVGPKKNGKRNLLMSVNLSDSNSSMLIIRYRTCYVPTSTNDSWSASSSQDALFIIECVCADILKSKYVQ